MALCKVEISSNVAEVGGSEIIKEDGCPNKAKKTGDGWFKFDIGIPRLSKWCTPIIDTNHNLL